ncbi:prepilin peptidase [Neptunomonas qingdaonensis]|uniref:Prepilin leader peptidase/N-methyltransferase n=1 Tax=Neptunomonas qingdaonensis TaxID=1045558 RepID=A0A1I2TGI0_9GAMM|nr:A24 family peptidase [Neptunomonas qingdaonensis]SFG64052.1 leader peptidase (prepilin peptidase) / N-methyltransferase [Neptunomonas qingdaonensis]
MTPLITWLSAEPLYAAMFTFVFALLVGSFLNVVIYRIPVMMEREWQASLVEEALPDSQSDDINSTDKKDSKETFNLATPASTCPSCQHKIRWYENIPVVSYLFLRGQCSHCKTSISLRYPLIELLTALLSVVAVYQFGFNAYGLAAVFFTWSLVALTFIDIDHQLLPDRIVLPLLWLGLLINSQDSFTSLSSAVWGAALGYLILWSIYWLFKLLTGKEGMGYGDFKLLAALGAWCGATALPLIILLSSVTGVILAVILMLSRKHEVQNPLPFGPYLAIAGWIALLWGDQITAAYLLML